MFRRKSLSCFVPGFFPRPERRFRDVVKLLGNNFWSDRHFWWWFCEKSIFGGEWWLFLLGAHKHGIILEILIFKGLPWRRATCSRFRRGFCPLWFWRRFRRKSLALFCQGIFLRPYRWIREIESFFERFPRNIRQCFWRFCEKRRFARDWQPYFESCQHGRILTGYAGL